MDKETALKALRSSPFIALKRPDISSRMTRIPIRAETEPVLVFWQSEVVGWIRMEGSNAVWRYGSMITGGSSLPQTLGDPLVDVGRSVADAIDLAWDQIKPEQPPVESQGGEPERFAASIEAGERPKPWSRSILGAFQSYPPRTAPAVQRPPAHDRPSTPVPGPLYETKFSPYAHSTERYPAAPGYTERQLDGQILETVHPAVVPASIGGAALVLAILQMPYDFYLLLRWVVPAMAIWICTIASGQKRTGWVVVFTLVAVLWNPLVPFGMPRSAWALPDIVGAILFARAGVNLLASRPALRPY